MSHLFYLILNYQQYLYNFVTPSVSNVGVPKDVILLDPIFIAPLIVPPVLFNLKLSAVSVYNFVTPSVSNVGVPKDVILLLFIFIGSSTDIPVLFTTSFVILNGELSSLIAKLCPVDNLKIDPCVNVFTVVDAVIFCVLVCKLVISDDDDVK